METCERRHRRCRAADNTGAEPEAEADASAENEKQDEDSSWSRLFSEPEPAKLLPEQSSLIGQELYLLVLQQVCHCPAS